MIDVSQTAQVCKKTRVDDAILTTGGAFGAALNPAAISEKPWGNLQMEFLGRSSGVVAWEAIEGQFGSGSYPIQRIAADPYEAMCLAEGFSEVQGSAWMSGHWYGGPSRSGEGFSVNIINGGLAVVTWYSYLPD